MNIMRPEALANQQPVKRLQHFTIIILLFLNNARLILKRYKGNGPSLLPSTR